MVLTEHLSVPSKFLAWNGHHPLVLFILNIFIEGTDPSVFIMSSPHSLADPAPRGIRFKSNTNDPRKKKHCQKISDKWRNNSIKEILQKKKQAYNTNGIHYSFKFAYC